MNLENELIRPKIRLEDEVRPDEQPLTVAIVSAFITDMEKVSKGDTASHFSSKGEFRSRLDNILNISASRQEQSEDIKVAEQLLTNMRAGLQSAVPSDRNMIFMAQLALEEIRLGIHPVMATVTTGDPEGKEVLVGAVVRDEPNKRAFIVTSEGLMLIDLNQDSSTYRIGNIEPELWGDGVGAVLRNQEKIKPVIPPLKPLDPNQIFRGLDSINSAASIVPTSPKPQ